MSVVSFETKLYSPDPAEGLGAIDLVTLPKRASDKLPSRGMVMVDGVLNGRIVRVLLQPDGEGSHWFKLNKGVQTAAKIRSGDSISMTIGPTKTWPEPKVPSVVSGALAADPQANAQWTSITPMARWDWLNWMDAVKTVETRNQRPDKLCSMLRAGKRRPCCFNRAARMAPKSPKLL
jgi:hypothetical protein